ncbi:adenosylcobinamide-phosphate guanylyltransferase [Halalkaliarchaeum desulfuricum]|uniref:Adenosylcobinamide-phosphate guanylyltransferase n=2 Tax=Halalkaliarchaeum desulfuricum TaxID=2055893 RepID=A0A343TL48_9EURY|nr:adenosylcobinamide-phosphate guanylyltransferase [Halalkaliarchaeum desulfuricum]
MCGGRGTRLESDTEKPLVPICGAPMVDRVRNALQNSHVDEVYAVVSPHAPATRSHLEGELPCIETPGNGYVSDLQTALEKGPVEPPVLTAVADLPLLASGPIKRLIAHAQDDSRGGDDGSLGDVFRVQSATTVVPAALKRELGVSIDGDAPWIPAGLNVVAVDHTKRETTDVGGSDGGETASGDGRFRTWDARLAVNVNRKRDVRVAERFCTVEER